MEIIIEGRTVDTKDIWDMELITNTRECKILVKIIDKPPIVIRRKIPYETRVGEFQQYWQPYKTLYESILEKWEVDKSDIKVFKL